MGFYRGPQIIRDGLVLYLDAANIKSYPTTGTTWTDITGNGNNATLVNGPTFSGTNKGSIVFDGVDDSATFSKTGADLSITDNAITCEITLKRTINPVQALQGHIGFGSGTGSLSIKNTESAYFLDCYNVNDVRSIVSFHSGTFFTNNQYNIIVLSFSILSGVVKTYTNGDYYTTTTLVGGLKSIQNQTLALAAGFGYFRMFGEIYQVKMYNRVLSDIEIKQNYNANKGRFNL